MSLSLFNFASGACSTMKATQSDAARAVLGSSKSMRRAKPLKCSTFIQRLVEKK